MDLPGEVLAGLPKIEVTGCGEFSLEPHKGLLEYEEDAISVYSNIGRICIKGEKMRIRMMNKDRIVVVGIIQAVYLPGCLHE